MTGMWHYTLGHFILNQCASRTLVHEAAHPVQKRLTIERTKKTMFYLAHATACRLKAITVHTFRCSKFSLL